MQHIDPDGFPPDGGEQRDLDPRGALPALMPLEQHPQKPAAEEQEVPGQHGEIVAGAKVRVREAQRGEDAVSVQRRGQAD